MVACVRVVGSQYPWSFLQGSLIPWQRIVSFFKSRVSCIFSSCTFQSKNIISWYPLFFVSALQFESYLFQCVVFNVYHEDHMLFYRVLHGRGILYLVFRDLGVFQARLDVLRLGIFEKLQVFCLCLFLM